MSTRSAKMCDISEQSSSKRMVYLDLIRVLACYMIVVAHSKLQTRAPDISLHVYNLLSSPFIGLFFMVSGALLLPVKDPSIYIFIKNRLSKVGIPLLAWSIVYAITHWLLDGKSLGDVLITLARAPFQQISAHLWFVYSLVGLYLFSPIISPWLRQATKSDLRYYLLFWCITLTLPYMNKFIPNVYNINGAITSTFFQFSGFLGYYLLGYYLCRFPPLLTKVKHWLCYGLILLMCGIFPFIFYFFDNINNPLWLQYLTINIAVMSAVIFIFLQRILIKNKLLSNVLIDISKMSYGIYLIHLLILTEVVRPWFDSMYYMPNYILRPLMAFVVLLISYAIIKLISFLPKSKWLIGV